MMNANNSTRELRTGWASGLAKASMALFIFAAVSGLAITLAPFHAAIQWSVLVHTVVGALLGFGDGSKAIAHVVGFALRRTVSSVSYLSQSSHTLQFGLSDAKEVDRREVLWLGGPTNFFTNLEANATWELTEGEAQPRRVASEVRGQRSEMTVRAPLPLRRRTNSGWCSSGTARARP